MTYILDGLSGKIIPRSCPGRRVPPSLHGLVDRLDTRLIAFYRRKIVNFTAIEPISDGNFDFAETVKDVKLGQRNTIDSGNPGRD